LKIKVLLYQQKLLGKIPGRDYSQIKKEKCDFICLPEYFFHPEIISFEESIAYLKEISADLHSTIIGGTTVLIENGKKYNTCYIYDNGMEIGHYKKINLYIKEIDNITPGNEYKVFKIKSLNIGILICADVLNQDAWKNLTMLQPDIIFAPAFSPYKEESIDEKFKRDEEIFVNGAKICNCPVIKVCSVGELKGYKLQGRSLIAGKNGVLWGVNPDEENLSIIKTYELNV